MSESTGVSTHVRLLAEAIGIDENIEKVILGAWAVVGPDIRSIIEKFYDHPAVSDRFCGMDVHQLQRLKLAQETHWRDMMTSCVDEHFERRARRVAIAHKRYGIELHVYVAFYHIMAYLVEIRIMECKHISETRIIEMRHAIMKYIAIDSVLTSRVYEAIDIDL